MENLNILATIATGIGLYFSLKNELQKDINSLRADFKRLSNRQAELEKRTDSTWSELLAITRQFKTTENK